MRPAVVAACEWVFVASLAALAAFLAWRGALAVKRRLDSAGLWRALRWILLGSFVLNVLGIWWGLPGWWAPIELLPNYILGGLSQYFSHGWFDAYPPLHYYVLSIVMAPFLLLSRWGRLPFDHAYPFVMLVNRLVSVVAAAGIVAATSVAGAHAFGRRQGLWAAGMMALVTPFLYYAKTANMDVPYLFWFALSLVYYVRILKGGSLRDYVLFATFATCSVGTKDQAYGLYLLMPVPIVVEIWQANRSAQRPQAFLRALIDRRLWIAAVTSAVLFALIHNFAFNWDGFMEHVRFIAGDGSAPYRVFDPTPAGRWKLFLLTLDLTQQAIGWPFTIAAVYGLTFAIVTPGTRRLSLWLLVPVISYYFSFINVILYNYDRFMLPVCLILALFGGVAFEELTAGGRLRAWRLATASLAFAYTLLYAGAVDYLMIRDSRYDVERFLRANLGPSQIVGTAGQREYLPRVDEFNHADVPNLEILDRVHPAFWLGNADYERAVPPETGWGELIAALQQGTAGYRFVGRFRTPLPWGWLPGMHRDLTGPRHERLVFTTVRNINPTIEVYEAK